MDNFTPDSGKLTFSVEFEGKGKLVSPVVGWTLVDGSLEAVIMVNGQVFTTVTEYLEELNSKLPEGQSAKVMFEQIKAPTPEPASPRRPTPEFDR